MKRVLLVDDHPMLRQGLRRMIEASDNLINVEEAESGKELIEKLKQQKFDLVILDISLPDRNGIDLISHIRKNNKNTYVLVFSIYSDETFALAALKAGASGYLSKSSKPDDVMTAVRIAAEGGRYISNELSLKLADVLLTDNKENLLLNLSERESEVFGGLAEGKTVRQIANDLSISPKTVSTYRDRLVTKLNLNGTRELIRYAILRSNQNR
jgi:two-component system, NarL family, invasion response regulator UvrY